MMSYGLLPGREEMAGEEAAVALFIHSTDTQCLPRVHNYSRYQGSVGEPSTGQESSLRSQYRVKGL